jgi:hypothetical protein
MQRHLVFRQIRTDQSSARRAYNRIGELKNEFDIFQTAEGDRTVLLQQLAKHLLSGFRKQFKTLSGNLKFLAKEVAGMVVDQNPVKNTIEDNSKASLMDPAWHIHALSFRVQKLMTSIASRIREYKAVAEMDSFDAWNNCLDSVVHLAQSYTHLWMLQQFVAVMNKVDDPALRAPLHIAESLFALTTIENDMGPYSLINYFKVWLSKLLRLFFQAFSETIDSLVPGRAWRSVPRSLASATTSKRTLWSWLMPAKLMMTCWTFPSLMPMVRFASSFFIIFILFGHSGLTFASFIRSLCGKNAGAYEGKDVILEQVSALTCFVH